MCRHRFATFFVLLAAAFCAIASADDSNSTRTVSGHEITHYKNGAVPIDLSAATIAALVPSGSSYTTIAGTGNSDGTFTISNVPAGFYWLQIGSTYLRTRNNVVNLDSNYDYRSTVVAANFSTTEITFDITNLDSWQTTDVFEIVCPNNSSFESTDDFLQGARTVGATAFTGTYTYWGNLSDAADGDQYYTAQLIAQTVDGYPIPALGRYVKPKKFTQAQGSDASIDGAFETISQSHTFEANIDGAALTAQALAANPGATLFSTNFDLDAYPGSLAKGSTTDPPDLILYEGYDGGLPLFTSNVDLGPVAYGNPYPSSWPLFVGYGYLATTNYLAPGATDSYPWTTLVDGLTTSLPSATSPIEPLVGVAQNPLINGHNFFSNLKRVGLTPLLEWAAPAVGKGTYYNVQVYQLFNSGGSTIPNYVASFTTQQTSLRVPAGLLATGQTYVFEINSYYIPGLNFTKNPNFSGPTEGFAQVISGMIQP